MTQETVLTSNMQIAKFMGYHINDNFEFVPPKDAFESQTKNAFFLQELQFHSSWSWLMPVLKKIKDAQKVYPIKMEKLFITECNLFSDISAVYANVLEYLNINN